MQGLRHVLWIGGPPGAGKTAFATRIARRHGLRWYGADTRTWQHRDRALGAGNAAARCWEAMSAEERWVKSTPVEMFEMSLHVERGPMVLDDLRALPESPLVLAEGSPLPAQAVSSGIADHSRDVWLIPTRDVQRALLAARASGHDRARSERARRADVNRRRLARRRSDARYRRAAVRGGTRRGAACRDASRAAGAAPGGERGDRFAGARVLRAAVGRRGCGVGRPRVHLRVRRHLVRCQHACACGRPLVRTATRARASLTTKAGVCRTSQRRHQTLESQRFMTVISRHNSLYGQCAPGLRLTPLYKEGVELRGSHGN
jgi:hypothetical protein